VIECALPPSDFSPPTFSVSPVPASTRGRSTVTSPDIGNAPRVLTPALLLPVQTAHPPADSWLRRLCRAILEDALSCLEGKGPSNNMGRSDRARCVGQAWQWVESYVIYLFSFTLVCAVLDLEAEAVRRQVRQHTLKDKPDRHREVREKVKETVSAVRETQDSTSLPEPLPSADPPTNSESSSSYDLGCSRGGRR